MSALDLIRQFEGYREKPYWDVNAYRAGYGSDTITTADGRVVQVQKGASVSRDDAERDLTRRVNGEFGPRAAAKVGQAAWSGLNEGQRSALTSIAYNYGDLPDSVATLVRSGDLAGATQAIRALGAHNGGINAGRREKEAAIFSGADLPPGGLPTDPQARNPSMLALAYRNGKMTAEDAALYEQGVAEGMFPKVERKPQADPVAVYQAAATTNRPRAQITPIQIAPPATFGAASPPASLFNLPGL